VADSGTHTIVLNVLDKDSVLSSSDTCSVTVLPGIPLLKLPFRDTTISAGDTLKVIPFTTDINGRIIAVEWYSQQTKKQLKSDQISISYSGFPVEKFNLAVCDDDSLWLYDTITIRFNLPPVIKLLVVPSDTVFCTESQPFADVLFSWSTYDRERDVMSTLFSITSNDSSWRYEGDADSVHYRLGAVGEYHWKLTIKDSFGNTSSMNGHITLVQEHTICFAGHSIICGMAGDGLNGGFRSAVLKGLRENLSPYHKIKAHGPITTPDMGKYPEDDSCYAISGSKAYEMALFLKIAYKTLFADIWVVMLGANAGYTPTELKYTIEMVDTILGRNRSARVYILTSPPFPADNFNFIAANEALVTFNNAIYDSVAARNENGFNISVVDVDTLLTDHNHVFDPTWFADHVHPNMAGYYRVGEKILEIMRLQDNPALKNEYYLKDD
jgi:hypothetical protein